MTAPFRFPRFFITSVGACPYLPGRTERKVFTDLRGHEAVELNDALGRIGFRRSQGVAYRPSCIGCSACVSVRVLAAEFRPNATQRKLIRRNDDLLVTQCQPWATAEQFDLLQTYLAQRHPGGGMAGMGEEDFADMVEQTPVDTVVMEYREPSGRLVGACLTDRQADGLSMIYSFFHPDEDGRKGLGTHIILDHIRQVAAAGGEHLYLGYWVPGSRRMAYKANYQPMERLTPDGWRRFEADDTAAIDAPMAPPAKDALVR